MSSADLLEVPGTVIGQHTNQRFRVRLDSGQTVDAYLGGRLSHNFIRVVVGDRVKVGLSPYNVTLGKIVHRD